MDQIIPENLDQVIDLIINESRVDDLNYLKNNTEEHINASSHHTVGRNLRNNLNLWWSPELAERYKSEEYPSVKPKIVEFFNDLGIFHADDMSGIIITSVYRKVNNLDIDLDGQINMYKEFWSNKEY